MLRADLYAQAQGIRDPDRQSFTGDLWYRTDVDLTADQVKGKVHLLFPGLFNECWLYVNGTEVAHRQQGNIWWLNDYAFEWDVDLSGKLRAGRTRWPCEPTASTTSAACSAGRSCMCRSQSSRCHQEPRGVGEWAVRRKCSEWSVTTFWTFRQSSRHRVRWSGESGLVDRWGRWPCRSLRVGFRVGRAGIEKGGVGGLRGPDDCGNGAKVRTGADRYGSAFWLGEWFTAWRTKAAKRPSCVMTNSLPSAASSDAAVLSSGLLPRDLRLSASVGGQIHRQQRASGMPVQPAAGGSAPSHPVASPPSPWAVATARVLPNARAAMAGP